MEFIYVIYNMIKFSTLHMLRKSIIRDCFVAKIRYMWKFRNDESVVTRYENGICAVMCINTSINSHDQFIP